MACYPNEHAYTHISPSRLYCTKCGEGRGWIAALTAPQTAYVEGPSTAAPPPPPSYGEGPYVESDAPTTIGEYEATITRLMREDPDFKIAMDSVASQLADDRIHPSISNVPVNDPLDDSLDRD
jgi:hypothetical protein